MVYGFATIEGDDATDSIISMHRLLAREDINCILLDGLVISMYNIVDGKRVAEETDLPIIAITLKIQGDLKIASGIILTIIRRSLNGIKDWEGTSESFYSRLARIF